MGIALHGRLPSKRYTSKYRCLALVGSAALVASSQTSAATNASPTNDAGSEVEGDTRAPMDAEAPAELLSQTGRYTSVTARTLTPGVREFTPGYQLWADGTSRHESGYRDGGVDVEVDRDGSAAWVTAAIAVARRGKRRRARRRGTFANARFDASAR